MRDLDMTKLQTLANKVVGDVSGAIGILMAYIGDQSGVYRALAAGGPQTVETLAGAAGVDARYLREWLSANAALGYVDYDPGSERFSLNPEQAALFAADEAPTDMQGFFQTVVSQFATHETALDVFRSGRGRDWGEHHACCFQGTDRFFRAGYRANLIEHWIPSLEGVHQRLLEGGVIADVGCGLGSSTVIMARAYPNASAVGFDFHEPSIEAARRQAAEAGLANARFEVARAGALPGDQRYDLICVFDALHDMGDPQGVAAHLRQRLAPGGCLMLVEPRAEDRLEDNLNPLAAAFYGMSTLACVPASRAQEVGLCLGAQAGERRLTQVLRAAGFTHVRRATETATNIVLEARA